MHIIVDYKRSYIFTKIHFENFLFTSFWEAKRVYSIGEITMKAGIGAANIALISTTFVGLALFLISAMIVLSLIPIYTSRKDVSVASKFL
jgi:hypothetical protein